MALINFFQKTFLKTCLPKLHHLSVCASSKANKSEETNECSALQVTSQQEDEDDYLPEPVMKRLDEDVKQSQLRNCKIVLRGQEDVSLITGVPLEIHCTRPARIHQPTKNAQQQGTRHLGHWEIDFDTRERWENPLMGWCSSGDPMSNVKMAFSTKEQAIEYCQKNRINFWVQNEKRHKKFKVRSYALNFHHTSKSRVSTK